MYFDTSLSPIVTVLGGRWSHLGGPAWAARACWCAVTPPPRASPGAAALRQSLADCQLDSWSSASIGAPAAPLSRPGMRLGMSRKSAAASSPKIRIHSHGGGASSVQWESLDGVAADESGSEDGRGCAPSRACHHSWQCGRAAPVLSLAPPPPACCLPKAAPPTFHLLSLPAWCLTTNRGSQPQGLFYSSQQSF